MICPTNPTTDPRCLLDACARRHIAFRIYQTVGAVRHRRMCRLAFASTHHDANPDKSLANEYHETQSITDSAIHAKLLQMDYSAGYWTGEDPVIEDILSWIRSNFRTETIILEWGCWSRWANIVQTRGPDSFFAQRSFISSCSRVVVCTVVHSTINRRIVHRA